MQLASYERVTQEALVKSQQMAKNLEHQAIEPEHFLLALADSPTGQTILTQLGSSAQVLKDMLQIELAKFPRVVRAQTYLSPRFLKTASKAEVLATSLGEGKVQLGHMLAAMVGSENNHDPLFALLTRLGITEEKLVQLKQGVAITQGKTTQTPAAQANVLAQYTRNLTELARKGKLDPVVGRDDEMRRLIQVLARRQKNNPVLVGPAGVGKSTIIAGLAQRIVTGDVPLSLRGRELLTLDMGSMLAGATLRGQFEERMKNLLDELRESSTSVLLFINEIHTIIGAGGEGVSDAANLIKPALARGEIQVLGATTPQEYKSSLESDQSLERRFQSIWVKEPSVVEALPMLRAVKAKLEVFHGVRIQNSALDAAVNLSARYITARCLPDKAIDLLDEAASRLRISIDSMPPELDQAERQLTLLKMQERSSDEDGELAKQITEQDASLRQLRRHWEEEQTLVQSVRALKEGVAKAEEALEIAKRQGEIDKASLIKYQTIDKLAAELEQKTKSLGVLQQNMKLVREEVEPEDIAAVVAELTGIPVQKMLQSERDKLLQIESRLATKVIGQKEAIEKVANCIRRSRAGLQEEGKPIGSFLFLGPTGVGKTELAKVLSNYLFDDEHAMLRLDMSEFMEKHSVARLIGAPPGYVGAKEGGQLTEAVRRKPFSVVLFDELEKAHPDVLNLLLQVLDDGRLSDSQGQVVDFSNTVIILTSNLGSPLLLAGTTKEGEIKDEARNAVLELLKTHFRPEFLNRIDEIVMFHALTRANLEQIAGLQLARLVKRLEAQKLRLHLSEDAKQFVIDRGFEPAFGARPLKRAIQKWLQDPLSQELLQGKIRPGTIISCDVAPKVKGASEKLRFSLQLV